MRDSQSGQHRRWCTLLLRSRYIELQVFDSYDISTGCRSPSVLNSYISRNLSVAILSISSAATSPDSPRAQSHAMYIQKRVKRTRLMPREGLDEVDVRETPSRKLEERNHATAPASGQLTLQHGLHQLPPETRQLQATANTELQRASRARYTAVEKRCIYQARR